MELLFDFKDEIRELLDSGIIKIVELPIKAGFVAKEDKIIVLTDYQLFNKPYRTKVSRKTKYKKSKV